MDGCPEADNDMDGVCDPWYTPEVPTCIGADQCPNVPETFDAFTDSDGCPDPDNDSDGIPDNIDWCPGTDWTTGPDGIQESSDEPVGAGGLPIKTREDYDDIIDFDGCHDSPGDDWDGDGLTDEEEVWAGLDPTDADTDHDGVIDGVDNCALGYNPGQQNTSLGPADNGLDIPGDDATVPYEDAVADACDGDDDNDGLPDDDEYTGICPFRFARDSDGDGSLDGYEATHGSNPCNAASKPAYASLLDSDGDGLTDNLESRGWGTNPYSRDSDADGCDDDKEVASVDADKQATILDVMSVARMAFGLIPPHPALDLDKSGSVNLIDALLAAKNSNLVETHAPCP
jgi:hypothetical protein